MIKYHSCYCPFFIIWIVLPVHVTYKWCLICWYLWPFIDSPYPSEGLEFLTLWCRMVNVSLSSWMITMRDYPQPWLEVKDMHLWGRLIGAEQEGLKRGLFRNFLFRVSEMCGLQNGFCENRSLWQTCLAFKSRYCGNLHINVFVCLCIQLRDHARCQ